MDKNEIREKILDMEENEILTFGRLTVKKVLDFVEGNHGLDNLKYRFYKWEVELGNENDKDYDGLFYSCHNEDEINKCVKSIMNEKICY